MENNKAMAPYENGYESRIQNLEHSDSDLRAELAGNTERLTNLGDDVREIHQAIAAMASKLDQVSKEIVWMVFSKKILAAAVVAATAFAVEHGAMWLWASHIK